MVKGTVERLPISSFPSVEQRSCVLLIGGILKAKALNPSADTSEQEAEIDRLIYALYDLTPTEITAVENI